MTAVGERILRREDAPILTGESRYVDDLDIPGALHVTLVRSPHAHARINSIDTAAAMAMPGVVAVYTGADLEGAFAGPLPCAWPVTPDMKNPPHYPLARTKAAYVGDAVAAVVARSRTEAQDAAGEVVVDYEVLPAVIDLEDALSDRVVIHDDLGTNASYTWALPEPEGLDEVFAGAAHVVKERYIQQRLIPMAMEPRGVCVVPSPAGGTFTVYSATQVPHILKIMLALTMGVSEGKIRVIAPAVGGGFGSKLNVYAEEALCFALAAKLRKPVRWTEERSEGAYSTIQGRGQIQDIELAADETGKLKAIRVRLIGDMGAYLQLVAPGIPLLGAFLYHGVYHADAYSFSCTSVFTTKTPTDAYRGAGRPEATYAIERAMDTLARQVGVDPAEIRRRNYIAPFVFPDYTSPAGLAFDSGNYEGSLDKALDMVDYDGLRKQQAERRGEGSSKHLGIGLSSYVEMCGLAPSRVLGALSFGSGGWESATVRMQPTGKVELVTGTTPHGQAHETCWSQIVGDRLGIAPDDVEVLHSDTAISPHGLDTYGSRSLAVGGTAAALAADKVVAKARTIAAHQLEAAEDDLEFSGGVFTVKGSPDKALPIQAVAFGAFTAHNLPDGMEPTLAASATFDPPNFVFPFGTHVCVVEVDEETGAVDVLKYVAVDDCGNQINPMVVEGQIHGGITQGLAQALFEEAVYDSDGNLQSATLADYLVPSAPELPNFELGSTCTPSPTNVLGVKGIGEAGTIASTPAVINAIVDALEPLGVKDIAMPASPQRVWQTIQTAKEGSR